MNAQQQINLDANQTAYFKRHLEYVLPETKDIVYAGFTALNTFGIRLGVPRTATTMTYYQYDKRALAKITAEYATDIPTVEVNGKAFTSNIRKLEAKRLYTLEEVWEASDFAGQGIDLLEKKALATREAIAQEHNRLFWVGNSTYGVVGVLSNASIPNAQVVADGTGSSSLWANKTGVQILRDLNGAVTDIISATQGVESQANLLVISPQRYRVMATAKVDTDNTRSVLEQFQIDSPSITTIIQAPELVGAFQGGTEGFLIGRTESRYIELVAPIVYEELAPQATDTFFQVNTYGRNGGAVVYYPLAFTKKYGI